jgi:hypothetical protein
VDSKVDSLHVKRIGIKNLVGYVYIVRLDYVIVISEIDNTYSFHSFFIVTIDFLDYV